MEKITGLLERVSTDKQAEEGYSIVAQVEKLEAFCTIKEYKNYEHYTDAGYSGSNMERPELQRLIADIKKGRIERVIVYKLDRLSRNLRDTMYLIEDVFLPNNIAFVSLTENLDTSTPLGRAMIAILSAFAQLERENIKERMQMGNIQRVKNGYWKGGGCVPLGYDYDKQRGYLVKNEFSKKIEQMYELYIIGYSTRDIARMLGIKHDTQVRDCLMRKTYTGLFEYAGNTYESKNEPIITLETYQKAMDLMQERSKSRTVKEESIHLLTGLLHCGKCGARMRYKNNGRSGFRGIMCQSKAKGHDHMVKDPNCSNPSIAWRKVEQLVIDDLFLVKTQTTKATETESIKESVLDILDKQYNETNRQLKKLYLLYASSSDDVLLEAIEDTKKKITSLQEQITIEQERNKMTQQITNYTKQLETIKDAWEHMADKERRDIMRAFINRIVLTDGKLEIFYKF